MSGAEARSPQDAGQVVAQALAALTDCLGDLTEAPDLSVGEALWRVYAAVAGYVEALELRPLAPSQVDADAPLVSVYQASVHGLYVYESRAYASLASVRRPTQFLKVEIGGEPVAELAWRPQDAALETAGTAGTILAALAPVLGLALFQVAQRRRMREQARRRDAIARLYGEWLDSTSARAALRSLAAAIRDGWSVETVRIVGHGASDPQKWVLLEMSSMRMHPTPWNDVEPVLAPYLASLTRPSAPAIVHVEPAVWMLPVRAGKELEAVIVLDAALTGKVPEPLNELADMLHDLARLLARVPHKEDSLELETGEEPRHAGGGTDAGEDWLASTAQRPGTLAVWQINEASHRYRHRSPFRLEDALARVRRVLPAGSQVVPWGARRIAAWLPNRQETAARERVDLVVDELSRSWWTVGVGLVLPTEGTSVLKRLEQLLRRAEDAEAILGCMDSDLFDPSEGGGLQLAGGTAILFARRATLLCAGRALHVSRTGARILWALGTRAEPLTAEDLVRRIWPGDPTVTVLNLYPHMSELRHRLTSAGLPLAVVSRRGKGYALVAESKDAGDLPGAV